MPIASCCSGRSAAWPKSPMWQMRMPSSANTKIVLGPRRVPAWSSCSDAIAITSPTGVAVEASGRATHHVRAAVDDGPAVVVEVLMRDQQQVDLLLWDLRVVEADGHPLRPQALVERVDQHRTLAAAQRESGLAVPLDIHVSLRVSDMSVTLSL